MHVLGELSVEEFLRDYWHKKPVLIRNAWPQFQPLLSSQELAGLSLEQEIETRIVEEEGKDGPWSIRKGPFTEEDYLQLPANKWTLLVQGVDQWIPEAADLLEHFRFIPSWRIDDLMISYAVDGGSVGPHYDQYDVFLLQAEGQREWRIGQMCGEHTPFMQGPKIRILENFEETDRWALNPGDMLYLPPALAHYGIAQGECQTYSIGFRAPSVAELIQTAADDIIATSSDDERYADAGLSQQYTPGLIDDSAAANLREALNRTLQDDSRLKRILGKLMTEAKYPEHLPEIETELEWQDCEQLMNENPLIRRSEFARFAYSDNSDGVDFYAAGQHFCLPTSARQLIAYLADNVQYESCELLASASSKDSQSLLVSLWQQHMFYCPEDDYGH